MRMMVVVTALCVTLCGLGCGKSKDPEPTSTNESTKPPASSVGAATDATPAGAPSGGGTSATPRDWSRQPTKLATDDINGIKFSIEVPAGFERSVTTATWRAAGSEKLDGPSIGLQIDREPPENLKAAVSYLSDMRLEIIEHQALPGGGYFVAGAFKDGQREAHQVEVWKPMREHWLQLTVLHTASPGIPNLEAYRAWAKAIALSLAPK